MCNAWSGFFSWGRRGLWNFNSKWHMCWPMCGVKPQTLTPALPCGSIAAMPGSERRYSSASMQHVACLRRLQCDQVHRPKSHGSAGPQKILPNGKNLNESPGNRKGSPDNPTESEDLEEGCPNGPGRPAGHRGGVQVWRESGSFRAAGGAEGAAHMLHSRPLCGARGCSDAEVGPPSVPTLSFVSLRLFGGVFGVGRQLGVE